MNTRAVFIWFVIADPPINITGVWYDFTRICGHLGVATIVQAVIDQID